MMIITTLGNCFRTIINYDDTGLRNIITTQDIDFRIIVVTTQGGD